MDFFQAQDTARRRSGLLVAYFLAAVAGIVAVLYLAVAFGLRTASMHVEAMESGSIPLWHPGIFLGVAGGTIAVIGLGSLFKTLALRSGGGEVARSLGGRIVSPHTTDPQERRLFNIVEEMSIASGVRVPEIYILPDEDGINAFAAGWSPDDAAVAVTRGALETLTRDELQGVIAHEFSHILNGDMRLNIRLIGLLFGILLLTVIGRGILRAAASGRRTSRSSKGGNPLPIILLGAALIVVGYIGVIFGRLIQAAVSRQREFLADAAAVQFTRNPAGIAGALKKIGGLVHGSRVHDAHATETSHLFFANALASAAASAWATHPPLVDRIRAIEPSFDGRFPEVVARSGVDSDARTTPAAPHPGPGRPPPLRPEQFIAALAAGADTAPARSRDLLDAIPASLRETAHDPHGAPILLLGLLAQATDDATAARERLILGQAIGPAAMNQALEHARTAAVLGDEVRLALVDLTLPAIRQLSQPSIAKLVAVLDELIAADYRTSPFEFALARIVRRALGQAVSQATGQHPKMPSLPKAPPADVAALLDAVARAGDGGDPVQRERAYAAGARAFGFVGDIALAPREATRSLAALTLPLQRLEHTPMSERARVLDALAHAVAADGVIHPEEHALLRAIAAALDCPAPLLAAGRRSD